MANFIPVLNFGPGEGLVLTFETPPEGDPLGESIATEKEQVRSVGGQLFTAEFYDYTTFNLRFILQSNATAVKLKRLFHDFALKGESFRYYPHSDDDTISYEVELESESVSFARNYPDGQGGFLWSFEFTLISVTKLRPRIVRRNPGPRGPQTRSPGAVQNLRNTALTSTSIEVRWDEPDDTGSSALEKYEVRLGMDGSLMDATEVQARDGFNITGLDAGEDYTIYVRAVNAESLRGPWESIDVSTSERVSVVSDVRNLRATETTHNSVTLAWDEPLDTGGSAISLYDVEITVPVVRTINTPSDIKDTRMIQITGLNGLTQYTFRVRAKNEDNVFGPWSTVMVTTIAAPAQMVPTAPTNLVLRQKTINEDGTDVLSRQLEVQFDWPTGGGSSSITSFGIFTEPENAFKPADSRTRTQDVTGVTQRTNLVYDTPWRLSLYRDYPTKWFARVWGVNANGIGPSASAEYTAPVNFRVDFHGNKVKKDGSYPKSNNFGSRVTSPISIDLTSNQRWQHSFTYIPYRFARSSTQYVALLAMALSVTDKTYMAISGQFVWDGQSTPQRRLLLLRRSGVSPFDFVVASRIQESGHIAALTSFEQSNRTRYLYLKYGDSTVYITQPDDFAATTEKPFRLTHASQETLFRNNGACMVGNYLYVIDYLSNKIFCYNINTGARQTSREITLISGTRPWNLWTNGVHIWFVGSKSRSDIRTDHVYCYKLSTKTRDTSLEFDFPRSGNTGLVAFNDVFVISESTQSTPSALVGYAI